MLDLTSLDLVHVRPVNLEFGSSTQNSNSSHVDAYNNPPPQVGRTKSKVEGNKKLERIIWKQK